MVEISLECAIVGQAGTFDVTIDDGKKVSVLKKAIKKEKMYQFPADELQLFLAKTENDWLDAAGVTAVTLDEHGHPRGFAQMNPLLWLKNAKNFGENFQPGEDQVHVLVVPPPPQEQPPTEATLSNKKRKLAELKEDITPSSFAKCKGRNGWVKWLKSFKGQIECHRVEHSDAKPSIPVVLLNKTFARFEENCNQIEFDEKDCNFARQLCLGMSAPYESEAELAETARGLLTEYLLADCPASTITPATVNGSVSDGSYRFGETLLLNLECKLQKGDGGGDPTMQNIAYYIKNLPDVVDRQFPCFLVDICGPLMSVFGIVNTGDEDAICEPLATSFPLLFFDNERMMVSLTRLCASLKTALQELTNDLSSTGSRQNRAPATNISRLGFPYKDSVEVNGSAISFQYLTVVQRYVFNARGENDVIVKFAKRYGKEVHEYCFEAGFAPKLLYCESLPNDWVFVVMEQLPLVSLRQAKLDGNGGMISIQLLKIKRTLAKESFVHGDLRECNVMWDTSKNRVVLIDFDWSGRDGVNRYPPFMNPEVPWPQGAASEKPLQVKHDEYWFEVIRCQLEATSG